jgi:hypothetical protein
MEVTWKADYSNLRVQGDRVAVSEDKIIATYNQQQGLCSEVDRDCEYARAALGRELEGCSGD